jgi:hypothetical protein
MWFKIVTLTIQTVIGEGPIVEREKGAPISDHKTKKTSPICEPIKKT